MNPPSESQFATYPLRQVRIWKRREIWAGLLFAAPLMLAYALTLQRGVGWWDSGELVAAAKTLSVAHRPGFPLYVICGRVLFGWLDDPRWAANLLSAVTAVAALLFLWRGFWLLRGESRWSAVWIGAGGWLVGWAPLFWRQAIRAEVYAPTFAVLATAFLLAAAAQRAPDPRAALRRFLASAYMAGLAFCLHTALAVSAWPMLVFVFLNGNFRPALRQWTWAAVMATLAMSVYLYVPLRAAAAPYVWGDPGSLSGFIRYLTASDSFGVIAREAGGTLERLANLIVVLRENISGVLAALGIAGFIYGVIARGMQGRASFILAVTGALVAATVVSEVVGDNFDLQAYLFPLLWALWWGWNRLDPRRFLRRAPEDRVRPAILSVAVIALLGAATIGALLNGAESVSPFRMGLADRWGRALVADSRPGELIVLQDANTDFLLRATLACERTDQSVAVLNTALAPAAWYRQWWTRRYLPDTASIGVRDLRAWPRTVARWWRLNRAGVRVDYGVPGWPPDELVADGWLARWESTDELDATIPTIDAPGAALDPDWIRTVVWYYYRLGQFYMKRGMPQAAADAWDEGLRWAPNESTLSVLRAQVGSELRAASTADPGTPHGTP